MKLVTDMAMLLIKMGMQNVDFCDYSPSILVISSFYAATAFLKNSKKHGSTETSNFCQDCRKTIFSILSQELRDHENFLNLDSFSKTLESKFKRSRSPTKNQSVNLMSVYKKQFCNDKIESIAMKLIDFFKIFDDWHCGLNQLKKFNKVPIE